MKTSAAASIDTPTKLPDGDYVIRWQDTYEHEVLVTLAKCKITAAESLTDRVNYSPWRGRTHFEVVRHLEGYSRWVLIDKATSE